MAEHRAYIYGSETDKVNCSFYSKVGVCRHGDNCQHLHNRPTASQTLLLENMYQWQDDFEDFYEDIFEELSKYGEIESLNVCKGHMIGNMYVKFREEDHAAAALSALKGRFYAGRPIIGDFSPVTDFEEATCRQYKKDGNSCKWGHWCNFLHLKKVSRELQRRLFESCRWQSRDRSHLPYGRGEARGPPSPRRFIDRDAYEPRRGGKDELGGDGFGRRYDHRDDRRYDGRRGDDRRGGGGRKRDRTRSRSRSPYERREPSPRRFIDRDAYEPRRGREDGRGGDGFGHRYDHGDDRRYDDRRGDDRHGGGGRKRDRSRSRSQSRRQRRERSPVSEGSPERACQD